MTKFNIMQSSPFVECMGNDKAFLISVANWELLSTTNINTKMVEVELVCHIINTHFNFKARL